MDPDIPNSSIEKKWQSVWSNKKVFESDPNQLEKKFITAAFPYPNSPQHIGHARTYTTADIYARYLRLKGYNVLFPMGFHVTGTPILAMAKRIGAKDEEVLSVFENIYGISRSEAASLSDPKTLVSHFSKEIESGMKEMGFSIDWRRKFYSYDEKFNKFIQWQFRRLLQKGFVEKGEYPIAWCPSDSQAVSAHDTKGDVDPELEEVTAILFESSKDEYLVVSTYRPETIYGVTNLWINPEFEYVKAKHGNKTLILAKKAAQNLSLQLKLEILGSIDCEKILKMKVKNPIDSKKKLPIYCASFVKEDVGTGLVMSVPAHAPLDFLALRDMGEKVDELPQVLQTEGYSKIPAKDIVEKLGVKNQMDPKSADATAELYTKEAHEGVMIVSPFKGLKASFAKEKVASSLFDQAHAIKLFILQNAPIKCRCGATVVVNLLNDQWFIDYGNPQWKTLAKEALNQMSIIPQKTRQEYEYTLDWLKKRPCTRAVGLGTKFPLDETKMIEALSDSTIYMAFYTIKHLIEKMEVFDLTDEFFDYVFLGKGDSKDETWIACRDSFEYWYPVDSRHSGADLIRNHLTVFIFTHVALFEKKFWPKQIATNGFVLMDGTKMSKSMGNILPLRKAISEFGADIIRFSVVAGAEISSDTDFNRSVAQGMKSKLEFISKLISESNSTIPISSRMDDWILSRLNRKIEQVDSMYSTLSLRELSLTLFYDIISDLQWYVKRNKRHNLNQFFKKWVVLISPIMPHIAEEFYSSIGNSDLVSFAQFPSADKSLIKDSVEIGEDLVKSLVSDIERVSKIIGKKPTRITLIVADSWKRNLFEIAQNTKTFDGILKEANAKGLPMKDAPNIVKSIMKNIHSLPTILDSNEEYLTLMDATQFLSDEFGAKIDVYNESESTHQKAKSSMPGKPAIILE